MNKGLEAALEKAAKHQREAAAFQELVVDCRAAIHTAEQALGGMGGGEAANSVRLTLRAFARDLNSRYAALLQPDRDARVAEGLRLAGRRLR